MGSGMVSSSITTAQRLIDAKVYPPTHHYDAATLTPHHPLDKRLAILLSMEPLFFNAAAFLDVGCSKGFFSLLAAQKSDEVLAVDKDQDALDCWEGICPANVTQQCSGFKDVKGTFDRVWIGNGHHYLYREDPNYIDHLAEVASETVIVEGPVGPQCREMVDFGEYQHEAEFIQQMAPYFRLISRKTSTSYFRGRAVWLFKTN